jgi:hypothetical protein
VRAYLCTTETSPVVLTEKRKRLAWLAWRRLGNLRLHRETEWVTAIWLCRRKKYCHNRGMALAHPSRRASREGVPAGVRDRHHGPRRGPQEADRFAGEKGLGSAISCPLGAAMDSSGSLPRLLPG